MGVGPRLPSYEKSKKTQQPERQNGEIWNNFAIASRTPVPFNFFIRLQICVFVLSQCGVMVVVDNGRGTLVEFILY